MTGNVVDFHSWRRSRGLPVDDIAQRDALWPTIRDTTISTSFGYILRYFRASGRSCDVVSVDGSKCPYTTLRFEGDGVFTGYTMGLIFTYGWKGRLTFSFSTILADKDGSRQGDIYRKLLIADDSADLAMRIPTVVTESLEFYHRHVADNQLPEIKWR
ncbi:hypothetical protein D2T29_12250 [Sinirhodobacter populi]|uniref:Uncharacterized protein n=1 Tax=Paenirhodobacter populi TaxID=2306993 RepID=A0A443KCA7_9RHOB|nr:hypothetical protein [Sinirhodobacter populi]RWR30437.1 hypothetical protein D2T29_12250 [Sinirhodobacter populi]